MTNVRTALVLTLLSGCGDAAVTLADGTACPAGARVAGEAPPAGIAQWCERAGIKEGPFVEWMAGTPVRKKREGSFTAGVLSGQWRTYFASGQVERVVPYVAGQMHGAAIELHGNGKRKEAGAYVAGIREGEWTLWYPSGARMRQTLYSEAGTIEEWTVFRERDGSRYMEGRFVRDRKDGRFTEYDSEGRTRIQGEWNAGRKQGRWVTYDATGAEVGAQVYQDGELVSRTGSPAELVAADPSNPPSSAGAHLPF